MEPDAAPANDFELRVQQCLATALTCCPTAPIPRRLLAVVIAPDVAVSPLTDVVIDELIQRGMLAPVNSVFVHLTPVAHTYFEPDFWTADVIDLASNVIEAALLWLLDVALVADSFEVLQQVLPQARYVTDRAIAEQRPRAFYLASSMGQVLSRRGESQLAGDYLATAIRLFDVSNPSALDMYVADLADFAIVLTRQTNDDHVVGLVERAFNLSLPRAAKGSGTAPAGHP